jgi:hypothetical protein
VKALLALLLFACAFSPASSQTLEKIFISDTSQIAGFLREFIGDCIKADPMYRDKGVIEARVHPFFEGKKRISLYQRLDDGFKDYPPRKYAHFMDKVILFHEYDEADSYIENHLPPEKIEFLLEEVGDRVFIAQTRKDRWVEQYEADGTLKSRGKVRIMSAGGSPFSIVFMIDEKTGKVEKLKTL